MSSSRIAGISAGSRLRDAVHRRAVDLLLEEQELKELLQAIVLFTAVDADWVSIIQVWNSSTCARVTTVGSSASESGECSARKRPSYAAARRKL